MPPLTWLNDSVPAAPEGIKVERLDDELHLTWQKPVSEKQDLTYNRLLFIDGFDRYGSSQMYAATGIRDTVLYLPVGPNEERGYSFSVSASTRYHIESQPSPETYYYLSRFPK